MVITAKEAKLRQLELKKRKLMSDEAIKKALLIIQDLILKATENSDMNYINIIHNTVEYNEIYENNNINCESINQILEMEGYTITEILKQIVNYNCEGKPNQIMTVFNGFRIAW